MFLAIGGMVVTALIVGGNLVLLGLSRFLSWSAEQYQKAGAVWFIIILVLIFVLIIGNIISTLSYF